MRNIKTIIMEYRAKCDSCKDMVRAMYQNPIIYHDNGETYIEVRTMKEADLIETINNAMFAAIDSSIRLERYLSKRKKTVYNGG